jgi:hypothetical protein
MDMDIHHGDRVEQAFYTTDHVLTLSFDKYGEYFLGVGNFDDIGIGRCKHCSVNILLKTDMKDERDENIFMPVVHDLVSGESFLTPGSGRRLWTTVTRQDTRAFENSWTVLCGGLEWLHVLFVS